MSVTVPVAHRPPDLGARLDDVRAQLAEHRQLGLLSISILSRQSEDAWRDYDLFEQEISVFLSHYRIRGMRGTDTVIEPVRSGNSFVILLGPPRDPRPLRAADTSRVQDRLQRALDSHLRGTLPSRAVDRFRVSVGSAQMRHDAGVECSRIIYRCLEESFANAARKRPDDAGVDAGHLRRIIRKNRVRAVYQPVVDLRARSVIGFEALTRASISPPVAPDLLFREALCNGVLWDFERVCRRRALEGLPPLAGDQLIFLNIERPSFEDPELLGLSFLEQLRRVGLEPGRVVLELTEHASIENFDVFKRTLLRFREHGFQIAMDDVGTGYSGLQTIAELEPDFLKVDMTLVRDVHLRPVKRELIDTILRFTEKTDTTLVAEGVEHPDELRSLVDLGVRCAQGYLFAKPASPPETPDWTRLSRIL